MSNAAHLLQIHKLEQGKSGAEQKKENKLVKQLREQIAQLQEQVKKRQPPNSIAELIRAAKVPDDQLAALYDRIKQLEQERDSAVDDAERGMRVLKQVCLALLVCNTVNRSCTGA